MAIQTRSNSLVSISKKHISRMLKTANKGGKEINNSNKIKQFSFHIREAYTENAQNNQQMRKRKTQYE